MDDPFFRRAEDRFYEKAASSKVVRVIKHQTGPKPNILVDRERLAIRPGKRISKTGHIYWETRQNRSDVSPAKKI